MHTLITCFGVSFVFFENTSRITTDTVVLKRIKPPSLKEFDALLARARKAAKKAGLQEKDIAAAIRRVRGTR